MCQNYLKLFRVMIWCSLWLKSRWYTYKSRSNEKKSWIWPLWQNYARVTEKRENAVVLQCTYCCCQAYKNHFCKYMQFLKDSADNLWCFPRWYVMCNDTAILEIKRHMHLTWKQFHAHCTFVANTWWWYKWYEGPKSQVTPMSRGTGPMVSWSSLHCRVVSDVDTGHAMLLPGYRKYFMIIIF